MMMMMLSAANWNCRHSHAVACWPANLAATVIVGDSHCTDSFYEQKIAIANDVETKGARSEQIRNPNHSHYYFFHDHDHDGIAMVARSSTERSWSKLR